MTNPLLQDWTTPFEIAPFDTIGDADFEPALDLALADHTAEIEAIILSFGKRASMALSSFSMLAESRTSTSAP